MAYFFASLNWGEQVCIKKQPISILSPLKRSYANEILLEVWQTTLHPIFGFCHTFDHTKLENMTTVQVSRKDEQNLNGYLLNAYIILDVSTLKIMSKIDRNTICKKAYFAKISVH